LAGIWVMTNIPPVIPIIQLPGEKWPNREILGLPITNTLIGSVVAWILIGLLILYVTRRRPKDGNEVPPGGFYNLFELAFEGLYGFIQGIAGGPYLRYIFSFFMTIFIIVLLSNWQSLVPGADSVGFIEAHVKVDEKTGKTKILDGYEILTLANGVYALNPKCKWISPEQTATMTTAQKEARVNAGCITGTGKPLPEAEHKAEAASGGEVKAEATPASAESGAQAEATQAAGAQAEATQAAGAEGEHSTEAAKAEGEGGKAEEHHYTPGDPTVPWAVVPFVRPPSTDLNMTAALALIAVVMVQVLGFRALGIGYLTKFFNFRTLFSSPLGGIDMAVGLLELIGEFAKILSFTFRLLGNVFAGSILLFVMSFLVPFLPWPFFILEFFVGIIQALVFGLLTAIFMNQATASHHGGDEHGHEAAEGAH
jgi:F0F1-type ATP synthase membrane subunit a